jgi:adenylate cyclase
MSPKGQVHDRPGDEYWHEFFTTGTTSLEKRGRRMMARLPEGPRCKTCNAPFRGFGSKLVRILLGKKQSMVDPRFCNQCTDFMRTKPGGTEINLTMLFADVRGSTGLAEGRSPSEFSEIINRFYSDATDVLLRADAIVDRLIGDEVVGIFVPGMAGKEHAQRALRAALEILSATGHEDPGDPWLPVGAGVHTGLSYIGTVGKPSGAIDMTALGDVPNIAARLASHAEPGEVVVSEDVCQAASIDFSGQEGRRLRVKGRQNEIMVRVFRAGQHI